MSPVFSIDFHDISKCVYSVLYCPSYFSHGCDDKQDREELPGVFYEHFYEPTVQSTANGSEGMAAGVADSGHVLSSVRRQKRTAVYSFTVYCIQDSISGDATIPGRWVIPPQLNLSGGEPAT